MHSRLFGWGMHHTSRLCQIIYQTDTTFILKIISSKNKTKWFIYGMYLQPKGSVAADLKLFAVFHVFRRHIVSKLQWARSHITVHIVEANYLHVAEMFNLSMGWYTTRLRQLLSSWPLLSFVPKIPWPTRCGSWGSPSRRAEADCPPPCFKGYLSTFLSIM